MMSLFVYVHMLPAGYVPLETLVNAVRNVFGTAKAAAATMSRRQCCRFTSN